MIGQSMFNTPLQIGGGHMYASQHFAGERRTGIDALYEMINGTIQELAQKNKHISNEDVANIKKKVQHMKYLEDELIKTEVLLEEYKYLTDMLKDYQSQALSLDQVRNLVGKQSNIMHRKMGEESSLLGILGSLQKLITGETEDFKVNYRDISNVNC
jgi:hypothetical protein